MKKLLAAAAVAIQVLFLQPLFNSAGTALAADYMDKAPGKIDQHRVPERNIPASKPQGEAQIQQRNQLKRLESHGRSINRLQRSPDSKQRQQARMQHRELKNSFKRTMKQYGIPTRIIKQPKISAKVSRGGYDKDFPNEKCMPFFESAKVACVLDDETDTKCIYLCYDKEGEPVGVH